MKLGGRGPGEASMCSASPSARPRPARWRGRRAAVLLVLRRGVSSRVVESKFVKRELFWSLGPTATPWPRLTATPLTGRRTPANTRRTRGARGGASMWSMIPAPSRSDARETSGARHPSRGRQHRASRGYKQGRWTGHRHNNSRGRGKSGTRAQPIVRG